jgi:hypothetical protein
VADFAQRVQERAPLAGMVYHLEFVHGAKPLNLLAQAVLTVFLAVSRGSGHAETGYVITGYQRIVDVIPYISWYYQYQHPEVIHELFSPGGNKIRAAGVAL